MKRNIILVEHDNVFYGQLKNAVRLIGKANEYSITFSCPNTVPTKPKEIINSFTKKTETIISKLDGNVDAIFVDIRIAGNSQVDSKDVSGITIATNLKKSYPGIPIILITDHWGASDILIFSKATFEIVDGVLPKIFFTGNEFSYENLEEILYKVKTKCNIRYTNKELLKEKNKVRYKADVAVITALLDPEFNTFRSYFKGMRKLEKDSQWIPDTTNYYFKTLRLKGKEVNLIAATDDRMGLPASTSLATRIINQFDPEIIVIVGICAGIEGKTNIGDIIIAEHSWDYGSGKLTIENLGNKKVEKFVPYYDPIAINQDIRKDIIDYKDNSNILSMIKEKTRNFFENQTELECHIKPFASGSAVIALKDKVDEIKNQNGKIKGFDMETYGVYYAADNCNKKVSAISIKGVCDFGTEEKGTLLKGQHQKYAAHNSVLFFKSILENVLYR